MATTTTTTTTQIPLAFEAPKKSLHVTPTQERRDVLTNINYYKDPGDGSLPMPIVIAEYTYPLRSQVYRHMLTEGSK